MGARTRIELNEELIGEVKSLTSLKTNEEVVDLAVTELVRKLRRKRRKKLLAMRHELYFFPFKL